VDSNKYRCTSADVHSGALISVSSSCGSILFVVESGVAVVVVGESIGSFNISSTFLDTTVDVVVAVPYVLISYVMYHETRHVIVALCESFIGTCRCASWSFMMVLHKV